MINKSKTHNKLLYGIFFCLMCISILFVVFYVLSCTKAFFTSDLAAYLLLAKAQIEQKQFFPKGFYYSTGIFIFTPELMVLLLINFVKDWILCREIAVLIFDALMYVLIFIFMRKVSHDNSWWGGIIAIILMCLPMGHYFETYYEAAYITLIVYEIVVMLWINSVYKCDRHKELYCLLGLIASVLLANVEGMRNLVTMVLPIVVALVMDMVFKVYFLKERDILKKNVIVIIGTIVGAIMALIAFQYLAEKVKLKSDVGGMGFVDKNQVLINFQSFVLNVFDYYGAIIPGEMLSVSGISACIGFVLAIVCAIISPVLFIIKYRKIKNDFLRFYILYANTSNFIVIYMMIFSSATSARYYHTIFWHNIVFASAIFAYIIKQKPKIFSFGICLATIATVFMLHYNYYETTVKPVRQIYDTTEKQGTIVQYLEDNDLNYGFATFWHAYKNMVYSNGNIKILAYGGGDPTKPFKWLTLKKWYKTSECNGKCFILLAQGETIDEVFFKCASEIRYSHGYTILIYEKHIGLFNEFNEQEVVSNYEITAEQKQYQLQIDCSSNIDNAYYCNGHLVIKPNGIWCGKGFSLEQGEYSLCVLGERFELKNIKILLDDIEVENKVDDIEIMNGGIKISFSLNNSVDNVKIEINNYGQDDIEITGVMVEANTL